VLSAIQNSRLTPSVTKILLSSIISLVLTSNLNLEGLITTRPSSPPMINQSDGAPAPSFLIHSTLLILPSPSSDSPDDETMCEISGQGGSSVSHAAGTLKMAMEPSDPTMASEVGVAEISRIGPSGMGAGS
jgi:hypothetical protein